MGGILVVLAMAGWGIEQGTRRFLLQELDRELTGRAVLLSSGVEMTPEGLDTNFDQLNMSEFEGEDDPTYLSLTTDGGRVVYRSPSLGREEEIAGGFVPLATSGSASGPQGPGITPALRTVRLPAGPTLRLAEVRFMPRLDLVDEDDAEVAEPAAEPRDSAEHADSLDIHVPGVTLLLARSTTRIDALMARLRLLLTLIGLSSGVAATVLLGIVVRASLRPLERLAGEIANLDPERLSARIGAEEAPGEMAPVVDQLNRLLADLEAAFERERTFSSDVAHELRTPLAGLRSTVEVELSRTRSPEEYRAALAEVLPIVERMQDLVETLLHLARVEAGTLPIREARVDLGELVQEAWAPLDALAQARGLSLAWSLPAVVWVRADRALALSAVRNLLENAVVHANEGGKVHIEVDAGGGSGPCLRVANTGSGVSQEQVPALFQRFFRADEARDASQGHYGLGLYLVQRIAVLQGLTLGATATLGGEFAIDLGFPREEPMPG